MSLEQDIERGRHAEAVLANPVYTEAYELIEAGIYAEWRKSRNEAEREQLHQLLRMLDKARGVVEMTMREGKVAADKLKQKQTLAQRVGLVRE